MTIIYPINKINIAMPNWLENNASKSIIGYTIFIMGATWGVSTYILEDNRINDYRSQVQSEKSRGDALQARLDIMENENASLRVENISYMEILNSSPDSFPLAPKKINQLKNELKQLKEEITEAEVVDSGSSVPGNKIPSSQIISVSEGSSFYDKENKLLFAVIKITAYKDIILNIELPDGRIFKKIRAEAGASWEAEKANIYYKLIVKRVNYIGSYVDFNVVVTKP
ncbi:MAG: hypothetical protein ACQ9MH_12980 [Nitrospinales bacterium]